MGIVLIGTDVESHEGLKLKAAREHLELGHLVGLDSGIEGHMVSRQILMVRSC